MYGVLLDFPTLGVLDLSAQFENVLLGCGHTHVSGRPKSLVIRASGHAVQVNQSAQGRLAWFGVLSDFSGLPSIWDDALGWKTSSSI